MVYLAADSCGRLSLEMLLDLPPTDNNIYFTRHGGRSLTKEARKYKSMVKESTALAAIKCSIPFRENIPYSVNLSLYLNLYSKSWPKKAKWRYKKIDTLNRTKLLLDALAEAIGVDDRHFTQITVEKEHDEINKRVEVRLTELWK